MKKYSLLFNIICFVLFIAFTSCTSMDEYYIDYISDAEKIYPGKADSVKVYPGYERAMVSTQLSSDPKVIKLLIYWNNKQDSSVVQISNSDVGKIKKIIISPLEEGNYSFELITFDAKNNSSVTTEGFTRVYGVKYINSLRHRIISESGFNADTVAFIKWVPLSSKTLVGTTIFYLDQEDEQIKIFMPKDENITLLPNYKLGETVFYSSTYIPEETAIDTFYTSTKSLLIQ